MADGTTTVVAIRNVTDCRSGSCNLLLKSCARQRWRILAKAIQLQKRKMLTSNNDNKQYHETSAPKSQQVFNGGSDSPPAPPVILPAIRPAIDVMRIREDMNVLSSSVRRFGGFNLIVCIPLEGNRDTDSGECKTSAESFEKIVHRLCGRPENWFAYELRMNEHLFTLNVHHIEMVSVSELMGFNNTGNICVWPSEEALSTYVLENKESFEGKSVLELGGGMTCLAGLYIAKYCRPQLVHLTDGNVKSVNNVQMIVRMNELGTESFLRTSVLKWETELSEDSSLKYDFVMCADCIFFDETRESLIEAIDCRLHRNGQALVMAPRRGNTFQKFVNGCQRRGFLVQIVVQYSLAIWKRFLELKAAEGPDYDEDIHYPVLIVLTRHVENA